jgi:sterol desaturase/sphingolipid hydroxylase (fatty acid hydroxylase superfamily)
MPINIYAILGPIVLALVLIEFFYCLYKKNGYYTFQDSISSLGTAILNQCTNLFVTYLAWKFFTFLSASFAITHLANEPWAYVLCFFGVDFLFYWFHRMGHEINFLWAAHMPHHSTEELNYAVALRASVTQRLASFLFYWPLVIVGFSPALVIEVVAFHLVLQFLPHTRVVPKLHPFIEKYFNTPSHHRVHHALNAAYIDKNYGGFLIIWDKLFGTFVEEKEDIFYGVTVQPKTWEPTFINFQVWKSLFDDFLETPYLWDKIRIWFMPTGWRPRGVTPHPSHPVWTKENFIKYQSTPIPNSYGYLIFQVILAFLLMFYVVQDNSPLNSNEKIIFSLLLWFTAVSWSNFLESKDFAMTWELIRIVLISTALFYSFQKYSIESQYVYFSAAMIGLSFIWYSRLAVKLSPLMKT